MTNIYQRLIHALVVIMRFISEICVMVMLFLTCADIILRFLGMPILGVYDVVSFLGAIIVSFAIAHTSMENGHVAVSFVVDRFPKRLQAGFRSVINFLGLGLFAVISWQFFLYAKNLQAAGEMSPTINLPYYPVVYGMSFATGTVCLVLFAVFAENLAEVLRK